LNNNKLFFGGKMLENKMEKYFESKEGLFSRSGNYDN